MFKYAVFVLLLLCSVVGRCELRFMTLNAEWLWTPYDGKVDGGKFNKGDMSKKQYLEELGFYVSIVKAHDIDLLALSEIENQYVAIDIAKRLGINWRHYFVQGRDTATGQDVALISRLKPVEGTLTNFGFPCGKAPEAKKRKCLSKVVGAKYLIPEGGGKSVSVLSAHFLSKRNENKKKMLKRLSQAYALSNAAEMLRGIDGTDFSTSFVVLGDFNDTYHSQTLKVLRERINLKGSMDCPYVDVKENNRRLRAVDHILYRGFTCLKTYTVSTKHYSDHDAVISVLR